MRPKILLICGVLCAGTLCAGLIYGALMERYELFPRSILVSVMRSVTPMLEQEPPNVRTIETIFSNIKLTTWHVERLEGLGAIDVVGNRVLGTDRLGSFFLYEPAADEEPAISRLDVELQMGYAAFVRHAQDQGLDVQYPWFRVHDVLLDSDEGRLFVSHHVWNEERACSIVRVSVADVRPEDIVTLTLKESDWRVLLDTQPCLPLQPIGNPFEGLQAGGRLSLRSPDELLITVGDHGLDGWGGTRDHPQDIDSSYGKVWSIDLSSGDASIVSMGHRNPSGLLIDDEGRIWVTEHGPRGGDELNLVTDGGNFGWPQVTYGTQYEHYGQAYYGWPRTAEAEQGRHLGYEGAVFVWLDSIGVSNLIQVDGFVEAWDGDLLVSSLNNRSLFRLRYEDGRVLFSEPIFIRHRIRDLGQLDTGEIVLWTDDSYLIELSSVPLEEDLPAAIEALAPDLRTTVLSTVRVCKQCHGFSPNSDSNIAPTLWEVVGRDIADSNYQMYSQGLQGVRGRWNRDTLDEFLRDPTVFAPGTNMLYGSVSDPLVRAQVITYLEALQ